MEWKWLAKAIMKFFDRRIFERLDPGRHHGFHDDIPDGNEGGVATGQLFIAVVETIDRKHLVVPAINRFEVVHHMGQMEQLAYAKHESPPYACVARS